MPYEPSGVVPTSIVTSVVNCVPACAIAGQDKVAWAAVAAAGTSPCVAVATIRSAASRVNEIRMCLDPSCDLRSAPPRGPECCIILLWSKKGGTK